MPLSIAVATVAGLFLVIAFSQPLAARLRLPFAVMLAIVGMAISVITTWITRPSASGGVEGLSAAAEAINDLPISSDIFLFVLLPILLFQGAVGIDVRHLLRDGAAIILLAIVAVLLSVGMIGGAVYTVSGLGLTACLLLGAIVATTDPSAVIGIFRELGAPPRLTRLVEGESLLNDATAIAVFNTLLAALYLETEPRYSSMGASLAIAFASGLMVGILTGHVLGMILDRLRSFRSAQVTLTLATPYLLYAVCSGIPLVSAVVAVVSAGITLGAVGRSRFSRTDFRFLRELLDQVSDWSTGLIFILAALLIPRILATATWADAGLVLIVVLSALAARALTLWVLAPLLARIGVMRPIGREMSTALIWGGLRGAMTLALVLSISESSFLDADTRRLIAILATGYTLFTLLVQGTSLRFVISRLRLNEMGRVERAFRAQALQTALSRARERVRQFARRAGISDNVAEDVTAPFENRLNQLSRSTAFEEEVSDIEKMRLALAALVNQERNLLLEQQWSSGLPSNMIDLYLYTIDTMRDAATASGRVGYLEAARRPYKMKQSFRVLTHAHRWLGIQAPLASYLARRYHYTLVNRTIVLQLGWHIEMRMIPVFGERICEILSETVARRREEIDRNIDAIRLQYPDYAQALEQSMVERYAHHEELMQVFDLHEAGIITPSLAASLAAEARAVHRELGRPGQVDIEKPKPDLLRTLRAFEGVPEEDLKKIARKLKPVVFADNTVIYRPGEAVDKIYFIANGAVEVKRGENDPVRLGRGQAFGQLRLLNPNLKPATVRSISYSQCFAMSVKDFRTFIRTAPGWSGRMTSPQISSATSQSPT